MECHGANGEGEKGEYEEALYGDRSLKSLTRLIERTMPEDDEKSCVGGDAAKVAAFIYDAFYSPAARVRLHPPVIDLSRLTNRQFRESVADLVGRRAGPAGDGIGLSAEYFDSKGMNKKDQLKLEREDAAVDFDYAGGPPAEGMSAEQFFHRLGRIAPCAGDGNLRIPPTHAERGAAIHQCGPQGG